MRHLLTVGASAINCWSRGPTDAARLTFNRDDEHRQTNRNRRPGENVAEGQPPVRQPSLHRGRSKFASEFQGSVRWLTPTSASWERLLPLQENHRWPTQRPKHRGTGDRSRSRNQCAQPNARTRGIAIGTDSQLSEYRIGSLRPEQSCNNASECEKLSINAFTGRG